MKKIQTIATGSAHSFSEGFEIEEKSEKTKALEWWNNLKLKYKCFYSGFYFGTEDYELVPDNVVLKIYKKENNEK